MLKGRQERQRDVSLYWSADQKFQPTNFQKYPTFYCTSRPINVFPPSSLPHFHQSEGATGGSNVYFKAEGKDDVEIEQIHPFFDGL